MAFPVEAVQTLIRIIREGLASGNMIGTLLSNWQEIVGAVIELVKWFLSLNPEPEPIGEMPGAASFQAQLGELYCEEQGVAAGAIPWATIIRWLIQLLLSARENQV